MPALAMCSMKGGTGKTAIAFNLAERAFASGLDVLLVDYDPQEGSIGLMDLRAPSSPGWRVVSGRVTVTDADRLGVLRAEDPDRLVICDLPGADSMALLRLLSQVDLVLSPIGTGASDLLAGANFVSAVRGFNLPLVFLPNNVPHILGRRETLLAELSGLGADVCPVMVQHRVAHLDSLRLGLGVCESSSRSPAAVEIMTLWGWVCNRLGLVVPDARVDDPGNASGDVSRDASGDFGLDAHGGALLDAGSDARPDPNPENPSHISNTSMEALSHG